MPTASRGSRRTGTSNGSGHHRRANASAMSSSNATSAHSSDAEEGAELTSQGLVAPFTFLRKMADATEIQEAEAARKEGRGSHHVDDYENDGDTESSDEDDRGLDNKPTPMSADLASPERRSRAHDGAPLAGKKRELSNQGGRRSKRRKMVKDGGLSIQESHFRHVVDLGIIDEPLARELFSEFYAGCSTFLPAFDPSYDTYESLSQRSPFCFDVICMIAAKVRARGGPMSETYKRIYAEVQRIAGASLFAPVVRQEAIQAMIMVAGWSTDGGWLSLGHAVRMAFEFNMHRAWSRLIKKIKSNKVDIETDRPLVTATRTWFTLFLFEHQLSLGTGRPMVLHEDDSVRDCQLFLNLPEGLACRNDMRLVSMVQLGIIKERLHKELERVSPEDLPTSPEVYGVLATHRGEFNNWTAWWDAQFYDKRELHEDHDFQRQSLEVQRMFAELFHNAAILRGIRGQGDVDNMPREQRDLVIYSVQIAQKGLETCMRSPNYRNGMRFAVHFTHASATFAGSFLIRMARLFPNDSEAIERRKVMMDLEELIRGLSDIPATRYARMLNRMLVHARGKGVLPSRSQPGNPEPEEEDIIYPINHIEGSGSAESHTIELFDPPPQAAPGVPEQYHAPSQEQTHHQFAQTQHPAPPPHPQQIQPHAQNFHHQPQFHPSHGQQLQHPAQHHAQPPHQEVARGSLPGHGPHNSIHHHPASNASVQVGHMQGQPQQQMLPLHPNHSHPGEPSMGPHPPLASAPVPSPVQPYYPVVPTFEGPAPPPFTGPVIQYGTLPWNPSVLQGEWNENQEAMLETMTVTSFGYDPFVVPPAWDIAPPTNGMQSNMQIW
ncbi:hypothetical protein DL93DRAFT_665752 [Clavulina sp. PMI_390]|nr:hypothetical protein DL93DRAFT_665752 [Clavulina sp. PMI_390]